MRLLAIDPASNKLGLAVFVDGSLKETLTLTSKAKTPLERRLDMAVQLVPFLATHDVIVSEEPMLLGRNNNGMQRLLGMIEKLSDGHVVFIHPKTVKKKMGSGSLDKVDVALAAGQLLKTEKEQEILADALIREAYDETDSVAIGLSYFLEGSDETIKN